MHFFFFFFIINGYGSRIEFSTCMLPILYNGYLEGKFHCLKWSYIFKGNEKT